MAAIKLMAVLVVGMSSASAAGAQDRQSVQDYASSIEKSFESDAEGFKRLYGADSMAARLVETQYPRHSSPSRIVRFDASGGTATVLLSGRLAVGSSGDQTSNALLYSGLHRLRWTGQSWGVEEHIPFGVNRIASHELQVDLDPSKGIRVVDAMDVRVDSNEGFFFGLNIQARIRAVSVDGRNAPYVFQDGFFWTDLGRGRHRVEVSYEIDVEREAGENSAMFGDRFGHVRNQYWWHPFFGFGVDNGFGKFALTIRAPERLKVATDLPQEETMGSGIRTVVAKSDAPVEAVTWAYDEEWVPKHYPIGDIVLTLFATPDYTPGPEVLVETIGQARRVLSARFGTPPLKRIAIIQARGRDGNGWHFLSNQAIVTGRQGGKPSRAESFPVRAFLGHEIAHLWTRPSGETRNFLAEGWATYAESLMIEDAYGARSAQWFWQDQARLFATSENARSTALNNDPTNSGVAYAKGAWVLAMLERVVGRAAFDRGMRAFVAAPQGRTGYRDFLRGFGADAAMAERFLKPWVEKPGAPEIRVTQQPGRLLLSQPESVYRLPRLSLLLEMADGMTQWRTVDISGAETDLRVDAPVARVHLDPLQSFLLSGSRVVELASTKGSSEN